MRHIRSHPIAAVNRGTTRRVGSEIAVALPRAELLTSCPLPSQVQISRGGSIMWSWGGGWGGWPTISPHGGRQSVIIRFFWGALRHFVTSPLRRSPSSPLRHFAASPLRHFLMSPRSHFTTLPLRRYAAAPLRRSPRRLPDFPRQAQQTQTETPSQKNMRGQTHRRRKR